MKRAGFGLIETLVALVLVGLVAGTALGALSSGYSAAARARTEVVLMELAEMKMAELRSTSPLELRMRMARTRSPEPFPAPFERFSWTSDVIADPTAADLFEVRVVAMSENGERSLHALLYRPLLVPGAE